MDRDSILRLPHSKPMAGGRESHAPHLRPAGRVCVGPRGQLEEEHQLIET